MTEGRTVTTQFRSGRGVRREMKFEHVPVMAQSWLDASVVLLRRLDRRVAVPPQGTQTTPRENGLSATLVVLSAMLVESAVNRTRYVRRERVRHPPRRKDIGPAKAVPFSFAEVQKMAGLKPTPAVEDIPPIVEAHPEDYVRKLEEQKRMPERARQWELVREVFAVRDALVHNHLWETQAYWPAAGGIALVAWRRLAGYGDRRFKSAVDEATGLTKRLKLNAYPTRVWRRDAYVALGVAMDVVAWLESLKREYIPVTHVNFVWSEGQGDEPRLMSFAELRKWVTERAASFS